jgi:hypothetical protein
MPEDIKMYVLVSSYGRREEEGFFLDLLEDVKPSAISSTRAMEFLNLHKLSLAPPLTNVTLACSTLMRVFSLIIKELDSIQPVVPLTGRGCLITTATAEILGIATTSPHLETSTM